MPLKEGENDALVGNDQDKTYSEGVEDGDALQKFMKKRERE